MTRVMRGSRRRAETSYALATPQVKLIELLWRQDVQGRLDFERARRMTIALALILHPDDGTF